MRSMIEHLNVPVRVYPDFDPLLENIVIDLPEHDRESERKLMQQTGECSGYTSYGAATLLLSAGESLEDWRARTGRLNGEYR